MDRIWNDMLYPDESIDYSDIEVWKKWRSKIITSVGGLSSGFRSEMLLRGYSMIEEMTGNISFIQGWALAITGRLPDKNEDRLLNSMLINTAFSDPRFWMFRTSRLGATVKSSPAACMAAGILTNDAEIFLSGAAYNTSKFYQDSMSLIQDGNKTLDEIIQTKLANKEIITGFGRLLARGSDERNPSLLKVAKECGLDNGKYLSFAFEVEKALQKYKNSNLYMNNGGLKCALLLDLGFTPHHIMLFYSLMLIIGMVGNIVEAYEQPPGQFLPLSREDIEYIGPSLRTLPPASDKQTIVHQSTQGRVVAMDSISFIEKSNRGDVIVCGSHGGIPAAEHAISYYPKAVIFNDAGKGKQNAGILGLQTMNESNIPAVAVDVNSAMIGNGIDVFKNGKISSLNSLAHDFGIHQGMSAQETSIKLLKYGL